jgi:ribose transport system ATP-binding protein
MTEYSHADSSSSAALEAFHVEKAFSGQWALRSFDLTIEKGEIHALIGENGSGKSTFIKILAGYHRPEGDARILIGGHPLVVGSAASSHALGCRFVHQDLGLIPSMSVLDNLSLGSGYPVRLGTICRSNAYRQASEDLSRVGLDLDPRTIVATLSPALKTGVAAARALRHESKAPVRLLVLDEPTAALPDHEVHHLIDIIRTVAATGVGVLYVTHRIDEVLALAHTATVLRDGRKVATCPGSGLTRRAIVNLLLGEDFKEAHKQNAVLGAGRGVATLTVDDLQSASLRGVSVSVVKGEVVGVAGITGSGREELLSVIFGRLPRQHGRVAVGDDVVSPYRPDRSIAAGMAYLPADRRLHGGLMEHTARENLTIADLRPFWMWPRLRKRDEMSHAADWFEKLRVRPFGAMDEPLTNLSGGNQQKVLFGKWLRLAPAVLLLDEPTQGVDIGAKAELHHQILSAAASDTAVLVSSSDTEELAALCTRVVVMRQGQIVAELEGQEVTVANISHESFGTNLETVA